MDFNMTEWEFQIKNGPALSDLNTLMGELINSKRPLTVANLFEIPGLHYESFEVDKVDQLASDSDKFILYGRMDIDLKNLTPPHADMKKREVIVKYNTAKKEGVLDVLFIPSYIAKYFT